MIEYLDKTYPASQLNYSIIPKMGSYGYVEYWEYLSYNYAIKRYIPVFSKEEALNALDSLRPRSSISGLAFIPNITTNGMEAAIEAAIREACDE